MMLGHPLDIDMDEISGLYVMGVNYIRNLHGTPGTKLHKACPLWVPSLGMGRASGHLGSPEKNGFPPHMPFWPSPQQIFP